MSVQGAWMRLGALRPAIILFFGFLTFYIAFSSGTSAGQGYTGEETRSAERILTKLDALRKGVPAPPMSWSRHGALPVLFDVPFVALGKFFVSPDFAMCFEPALFTAALVALLYLWLRKVTSPDMSLLITFIGALGTMLWPYAYIGLETKQAFFVLLAGYMGLACGPLRGWSRVLAFAVVCGLVISVKSTALVLFPAVAWLLWVQFGGEWRRRWVEVAAILAVMGVMWIATGYTRNFFWAPIGGGWIHFRNWLIDSPFTFFSNLIGIFGSPTKGLFVYAPVLLVSLYAVPRSWRTHRQTTIFVLLVVGGLVFLLAMLRWFADEVWGSRYMHTTIAPLLLLIGATRPALRWRKEAPLLVLGAVGLVISFLGAIYYYGAMHAASIQAGQNTTDWLLGDGVWNAVRFHARVFAVWLRGGTGPVWWTPAHVWMYDPPAGAPPWKTIDLRAYCEPQSVLLNSLRRRQAFPHLGFYVVSLIAGVLLVGWAVRRTIQENQLSGPPPGAIEASAMSLEAAATARREPDLDRT